MFLDSSGGWKRQKSGNVSLFHRELSKNENARQTA